MRTDVSDLRFQGRRSARTAAVNASAYRNRAGDGGTSASPAAMEHAPDGAHRGSAEVYVYILIEHQSSVNYLMPFRLLSYMVHKQTTGACPDTLSVGERDKQTTGERDKQTTGERERSEQEAVSIA